MKPRIRNASPSITNTPPVIMSATKNALPSGDSRTSWGMARPGSFSVPSSFSAATSTLSISAENSQLAIR